MPANAAEFKFGRSCAGGRSNLPVTGSGYVPGSPIAIQSGKRTLIGGDDVPVADARGRLNFTIPTAEVTSTVKTTLTIFSEANPAVRASQPLKVVPMSANFSLNGDLSKPRRLRAQGFTHGEGTTLYEHYYSPSGKLRTYRVGRLKGPCRSINIKRYRVLRQPPKEGLYRVYFNTNRNPRRDAIQTFLQDITVSFGR